MNKSAKMSNTTQREELTLNTLVGDTEGINSHSSENENKVLLQRIENTPIDIYCEDGKVALKVGKWTCSEVLEKTDENIEKLLDLVRRRDWMLMASVFGALIEIRTEYNGLTKAN